MWSAADVLHSKLESKFKKTYPDLDLKRGQLGKLVERLGYQIGKYGGERVYIGFALK